MSYFSIVIHRYAEQTFVLTYFNIIFFGGKKTVKKRVVKILTILYQHLRENNLAKYMFCNFWDKVSCKVTSSLELSKFAMSQLLLILLAPSTINLHTNRILKHVIFSFIKQVNLNVYAPMNLWNTDYLGLGLPPANFDEYTCHASLFFSNLLP